MSAESDTGPGGVGDKRIPHRAKFTENLLDNELILKALEVKTGQTVLDAGCGNGYMSKLFSKAVGLSGKVYALDRDDHFLKVLRDETQGSNIETIQADMTEPTRIKESSVDVIYVATVIHALSKTQIQSFLQETKRLLKPEGLLAIVEIEKKETPFGPPMKLRYSPEELKEIVPLAAGETVQAGKHFYMQVFRNKRG